MREDKKRLLTRPLPLLRLLCLLRLRRWFKTMSPANIPRPQLALEHLQVRTIEIIALSAYWAKTYLHFIVPEPRHPLGGLKRLGTVMNNRRKSIAQPAGSFFSDKKSRSPFAPFKRGDSRDMQIPESPSPGPDRPDTAFTAQDSIAESARHPSESRYREGLRTATPTGQEPQFVAPATNGGGEPVQEAQAAPSVGIANITPNEVYWK